MTIFSIIAIVVGSIFGYAFIAAFYWAAQIRIFKTPAPTGTGSLGKGTNGMDREDLAYVSAFWPLTFPALIFYYTTKYIALIFVRFFGNEKPKKVKQEPVFCDECRVKLNKGPHR